MKNSLRFFHTHFVKTYLPFLFIGIAGACWLFLYRSIAFQKTDVALAGQQYGQSQYVLGDASPHKISDAVVYTYAADRYIHGEDPTKINFEHPPLGKYLLGLSLLLFGNVTILNFVWYLASAVLFWRLAQKIIRPFWIQQGALFLLLSLALLPKYTFQGLLDIPLLFFTLLFFVGLVLFRGTSWWRMAILGISLGAIMSIKYFFPSLSIPILLLALVSYREKSIKLFLVSLLVAGALYLATYALYFFHGHSVLDFLKFEWYRFRWWTGDRTMPKFLLLDTIMLGKFKGWWGENEYEVASSWSPVWPTLLILWIASIPLLFKKFTLVLIFLFSGPLFVFYLLGAAASERYLIQLFPFWILGVGVLLEKVVAYWGEIMPKRR